MYFVQLQGIAHSLRRRFAVAGEHRHRGNASLPERLHCLCRIRFHCIRNEDISGIYAVHCQMHCRADGVGCFRLESGIFQISRIACQHLSAVHPGSHAVTGDLLDIRDTLCVNGFAVGILQRWLDADSASAANSSCSSAVTPTGFCSVTWNFPSVSVPVLSMTTVCA